MINNSSILIKSSGYAAGRDSIFFILCLLLFGLLAEYPLPVKLVAVLPLSGASYLISRNLQFHKTELRMYFHIRKPAGLFLLYCLLAIMAGIAGALYYRESFAMPIWPQALKAFTFTAAGIAITEELLFRGFLQQRLLQFGITTAVLITALAHAAYKTVLFISPLTSGYTPLLLFYTWSLGAFIFLGWLRVKSKSILPPILAHLLFDILVYGNNYEAPVWVW